MAKKHPTDLPSRKQILDFVASSDQPAGKREIARAFGIRGDAKIALKKLLNDMADEGLIETSRGRAFNQVGGVPRVTVLKIVEADDSGSIFGQPEHWEADTPPPKLRIIEKERRGALGIGDRVLARTEERGDKFVAHPLKKLAKKQELVLGVLRQEGARFWLTPVEKKERRELPVSDVADGEAGDLVLCDVSGRGPRVTARVDAVLGDPFAPKSFSLIAIHKYELPHEFGDAVTAEAKRVAKQPLGEREDLTHLPIVAIDPADARDHDDAIWAARDEDEDNKGGWKAIVAIADVSFYVRPDSALDKAARARGNSVYFPDRVVPMLPETLSADICSLKEGEDRAALACHLQVAKAGTLRSWRFSRARVKIAANIAYEDAQAAIDGEDRIELASSPCSMPELSPVPCALVESTLRPLWACWRALHAARVKRGPLELELPERRVTLDEKGRILSVAPRERLDAHKLIEDYMIAANVAAAKALEAKKASVMYRVHEPPSREKLVALKDYLKTFGIEFALGQVVKPETFNRLIEQVGDADFRPQVMEQILRSQTQAVYGPQNHGHFGLALGSYAHFTSPIRRYADLLVHRALVRAYGLGPEANGTGLTGEEAAAMDAIGELISNLERRAMVAERETMDRYVAAYLSDQVGALVKCRITGVQPFGFFATVEDLGGDGLVPAGAPRRDYYRYDEAGPRLIGGRSGETYTLGQRLTLRLAEANPVSGGLRFEVPNAPRGASRTEPQKARGAPRGGQGRRGRPANIRHQGRRKK